MALLELFILLQAKFALAKGHKSPTAIFLSSFASSLYSLFYEFGLLPIRENKGDEQQ